MNSKQLNDTDVYAICNYLLENIQNEKGNKLKINRVQNTEDFNEKFRVVFINFGYEKKDSCYEGNIRFELTEEKKRNYF